MKQFEIAEKFEIEGRGAVVVIDVFTEKIPGKAYHVKVTGKNGELQTTAYKEYFLRRNPEPIEKEAYMLKGLHKVDIADKATITFIDEES